MKRFLAAAVAIGLGAGSANAAEIVRTYTNVSTFAAGSGPLTALTLTFTVTFDPASTARVPTATLNAFTSSSPLPSFAGPNGAAIFRGGGNTYLVVGGLANFGVQETQPSANDFFTFFQFNRAGDVVGTDANAVSYSNRGTSTFTRSISSVTTAVQAPVPEPATWAMFIGGFGLIGATVRRQRVTARFA